MPHGGQGGDAGVLDEDVLGGRGPALHAVDHHDVGAGGHGQLDVVVDPGGARPSRRSGSRQSVASRSSSILMRRSSGPTQSG